MLGLNCPKSHMQTVDLSSQELLSVLEEQHGLNPQTVPASSLLNTVCLEPSFVQHLLLPPPRQGRATEMRDAESEQGSSVELLSVPKKSLPSWLEK